MKRLNCTQFLNSLQYWIPLNFPLQFHLVSGLTLVFPTLFLCFSNIIAILGWDITIGVNAVRRVKLWSLTPNCISIQRSNCSILGFTDADTDVVLFTNEARFFQIEGVLLAHFLVSKKVSLEHCVKVNPSGVLSAKLYMIYVFGLGDYCWPQVFFTTNLKKVVKVANFILTAQTKWEQ